MTTNTFRSDLNAIYNVIQNTLLLHPKQVIIENLRDYFSRDSYYHFVQDNFGFPKTVDHTDLELGAGISDDLTTRIFIGEPYRPDLIFYPALLVKSAGSRSNPYSFNDLGGLHYKVTRFVDGYGNEAFTQTPSHIEYVNGWEGNISIDIKARSHAARDELAELVSIFLAQIGRQQLQNSGVFVKPDSINIGSPSEIDDRQGVEKLYQTNVSCTILSDWRIEIPISNTIDAITLCVDFGNLMTTPSQIAPNLRVSTKVNLLDSLLE